MSDDKHAVRSGNCWEAAYSCRKEGCRPGDLCDICHRHGLPRGYCEDCPRCTVCDAKAGAA